MHISAFFLTISPIMCQFCIFTHLIQFVSNYSNRIHVLTYNNPRLMPHYDYKAETLFFSYSLIPNYTVIYLHIFIWMSQQNLLWLFSWPSWDQFFTHVPCTYLTCILLTWLTVSYQSVNSTSNKISLFPLYYWSFTRVIWLSQYTDLFGVCPLIFGFSIHV